ncbi:MAG: helix-turn-helix domain-containing protein [Anaerolineaceae bacterium]|nr:helix-turn-helix domain-containing protein [Anaerolineaceae bacterium]
MNIGDRIKAKRIEHGLTLEELAQKIGVNKTAIHKYENGVVTNIPLNRLEAIADALDCSPVYLMMGSDSDLNGIQNIMPIRSLQHHRIPLIGAVALGEPILAEQEYDVFVDAPIKADYALRTEGDSMNPTYLDGDIVFIRAVDEVNDGTVAVVLIDDSATLKHVYHQEDGLWLTGDNPAFPPMSVKASEHDVIRILGIPVGYTRMYRNGKKK